MTVEVTWTDIALRLGCALAAGSVIGLNREEHGRAAGLRTTVLVCLAAALSMILANLLLGTVGKDQSSFVSLDVMRLPLGVLSGMGFIGAGAILRRDNMILGVTTAATLWFVTMMGICFGSGELVLGGVAFGAAMTVLQGFKWIEKCTPQYRQAVLTLMADGNSPSDAELHELFSGAGYKLLFRSVCFDKETGRREIVCAVRWRGYMDDTIPPAFIERTAARFVSMKLDYGLVAEQ